MYPIIPLEMLNGFAQVVVMFFMILMTILTFMVSGRA